MLPTSFAPPCQFPQFSLTSKQKTPGSPGAFQKQKYKSTMFNEKFNKPNPTFQILIIPNSNLSILSCEGLLKLN
jgi:hypothetical protein